jgi:hypothetical protein
MIRRLLETRKQSERILLVAFLWAILLMWALTLAGALRRNVASLRMQSSERINQRNLIAQRSEIEGRLAKARTSIDRAKTLNALKLSSAIDSLARDTDLTVNIASPVSKASDIFNTNTVRVTCRNASLEQLLNFTQSIRAKAPYLAIRKFKISSDSHDAKLLNAEVEVESFELNQTISQ